jgi:hypothetical protein
MFIMFLRTITLLIITTYLSAQSFDIDINMNASQKYPSDVSFAIIDLKYDGKNLKICEFGEAFYCDLTPYFEIHDKEKMCTWFWNFFRSLKNPLFLITSHKTTAPIPRPITYAKFAFSGFFWDFVSLRNTPNRQENTASCVSIYGTFDEFKNDAGILQPDNIQHRKSSKSIIDTHGIFIAKELRFLASHYHMLRKKYPELILMDYVTSRFVQNKLLTHLLFAHDASIEKYRPDCRILRRKFTPNIAQKIIKEIPSAYYVIKPIDSCCGKGVIFVEQKGLAHALYLILNPIKITSSKKDYQFWKKYRKKYFLVESFEQSQPTIMKGKHYDATMRVVFSMAYDGSHISIDFFDAYWKLPEKALEDNGSFVEKHKSHVRIDMRSAVEVDRETYQVVTDTLRRILPTIYFKMIVMSNTPKLLQQLSKKIHGSSTDIYAYKASLCQKRTHKLN